MAYAAGLPLIHAGHVGRHIDRQTFDAAQLFLEVLFGISMEPDLYGEWVLSGQLVKLFLYFFNNEFAGISLSSDHQSDYGFLAQFFHLSY